MRGRAIALGAALAAEIALALPALAAPDPPPAEEKEAEAALPNAVKSGAFEVYSAISRPHAAAVLKRLERFRVVFASVFRFKRPLAPTPPKVYVFADKAAYDAFAERHQKTYVGRPAYFTWRHDSGDKEKKEKWHWTLVSFARPTDAELDQALLHELTHVFMNFFFEAPDLWLDEGLAVYLSGTDLSAKKVAFGRVAKEYVAEARAAAKEGSWIALADLAALGSEDDAKFTRLHYAEAWLLVHYLLHADKRETQRLNLFLLAYEAKAPCRDRFLEVFGKDLGALDDRLKAYAEKLAQGD